MGQVARQVALVLEVVSVAALEMVSVVLWVWSLEMLSLDACNPCQLSCSTTLAVLWTRDFPNWRNPHRNRREGKWSSLPRAT